MNPEPWRLRHNDGLNGLRGIAIALVVIRHVVGDAAGTLGAVGVTVFFTLSGFLITALLLQEFERQRRISLPRFWGRRARRLFPALAVLLLVVGALERVFLGNVPYLGAILLYAGNWAAASGGLLGLLGHTWSLAVEEQFYLVWPVVLVLVVRRWGRNGVAVAAAAGALASFGWRTWLAAAGASGDRLYFGTDTRADALLVGAALAAVMVGRIWAPFPRWVLAAALALIVVTGLVAPEHTVAPTAAMLLTAVVLRAVVTTPTSWLDWTPVRWLGERSYGLYLWHYPVIDLARSVPGPPLVIIPVAVALSLALTILSWRLVERPFRSATTRHPVPVPA